MINIKPFHTPKDIEAESFAIIDAEIGEPKPFSGAAWEIARRMVHSCADFEILEHLHLPDQAIQAGVEALCAGCTIYTDTEMARIGMSRFRLDRLGSHKTGGIEVMSVLSLPGVAERAEAQGCTRSRAGVELAWQRSATTASARAIWAFGNAPTALLALLELCAPKTTPETKAATKADPEKLTGEASGQVPSLIIGLPVGFVNAEESKEVLLQQNMIPCLTLRGRKGGSTLAAAVVNALAELALRA